MSLQSSGIFTKHLYMARKGQATKMDKRNEIKTSALMLMCLMHDAFHRHKNHLPGLLNNLCVILTAFARCRNILKTVKNVTDRPPVHTKTAHFLPADFENGRL